MQWTNTAPHLINPQTTNQKMKAIIAQLIASAIDEKKIPELDCFDMSKRYEGSFFIRLNDGTEIKVTCEVAN